MYRYTMRSKDGGIFIKDTAHLSEDDLISFLSDKLAEQEDKLSTYEDTGLTPEEIKKMSTECDLSCVDYKSLEEQGLLIKLPCKVGDIVFTVCNITGINSYYITDIRCDRQHGWYALLGFNTIYHLCEFGKTVFLTREEAEEALKGSV